MTIGLHDLVILLPFARVTIAGSFASLAAHAHVLTVSARERQSLARFAHRSSSFAPGSACANEPSETSPAGR